MRRIILFFLLSQALPAFGGAAHFVRKGGSDSNDGHSWPNAWATPKTIAVGDSLIIGAGTWYNVHINKKVGKIRVWC